MRPKELTPEQRRTRNAASHARHKGAQTFEYFDPHVIFERDGWLCKVCGKSTPLSLAGQEHPDSPTLDHIIPLSKGGTHQTHNCQCACKACNQMSKNNRLGADEKKAWAENVKKRADELGKLITPAERRAAKRKAEWLAEKRAKRAKQIRYARKRDLRTVTLRK
jgi:5-methylcytosine-specific restriction endonuclease McrA